jgi:hypothetical protein
MVSRSIYNLKIDTIYMYDIQFDRSFLQLSNRIRHVMPSTDTKPELTAKASMAQPVSQPAVYANGLREWNRFFELFLAMFRDPPHTVTSYFVSCLISDLTEEGIVSKSQLGLTIQWHQRQFPVHKKSPNIL